MFGKPDHTKVKEPFFAMLGRLWEEHLLRKWWFKQMTVIIQDYDEDDGYRHWYTTIARKFLPKNAVHVSKKKGWYFLDLARPEQYKKPILYEECSASDVYMFQKNNSITDAVKMAWTHNEPLDMKKVITIGVVAIIVVIVVWSVMGGS